MWRDASSSSELHPILGVGIDRVVHSLRFACAVRTDLGLSCCAGGKLGAILHISMPSWDLGSALGIGDIQSSS